MTNDGFDRAAGVVIRPAAAEEIPGVPFYAAHGYRQDTPIELPCGEEATCFIPLYKELLQI